ncbi:hypothetical protein [Sphingomonas pituitosa]|uniref:hypothetical protein n=1 Tax=Sphingomonas pituitosa TaxID=99597 RepID=UPI00082A35FF|nr:hypothetical protein [Sphingomonas pituitosa]
MTFRRLARVLPILLALAPWPALADVTASYQAGKDRLTVEVADNGDARVEVGEFIYIRHGGEVYLTLGKLAGDQVSGRRDDMLKLFGVLFRADPETASLAAPAPLTPIVEPLRETEVLGIKGQVWRIWPKGKSDPAGSIDAAFTASPRLAPVQQVLQSAVTGFLDVFGPLDKHGRFRAILAAMNDKGAPLMVRDANTVQLLALEEARIAPARLAIPEDLISGDALELLARQMQAKTKAEKNP